MELGSRKTIRLLVWCLILGVFFAVLTSVSKPTEAATGINQTVNFQGRLLTAAGATVPDGYYNLQFKIYQDGDGQSVGNTTGSPTGSLKWTENYLNSASHGVRVQNGYFSVALGSITAFGSSVDWNQSVLWLSMNVGNTNASCTPFSSCSPDGEMVPMQSLTSAVYALNAGQLGGMTAAQFGQLAGSQTFTGANIFQPTTNVTGVKIIQNSSGAPTADIFNVQSANNTNLIQVTGPSANNAAITLTSLGAGNAITLNSAGAINMTGSGASTWDIGNNTLSVQTANNGAITTGTGLLTVGGNLTFNGTSARTITGPGTGGLTITDASGPITISTTGASGTRTISFSSAGALNMTASAASAWDIGNNVLSIQTANNGNITTGGGLFTMGGNLSMSAAAPTISASTANAGLTVQANGNGVLTLNTSGSGIVNVGTTNSTTVNIGNNTAATGITVTGGALVLAINNTSTIVKTNTNSSTAFQVQNSGSSAILGVNTSTPQVTFTATSAYATNGTPLVNTSYTSTNTTAGTETGQAITVTDTGIVTTGTDNTNGMSITVGRTGATGGTLNTYGLNLSVNADGAGTGTHTAYGVSSIITGTPDAATALNGSAILAGTTNSGTIIGTYGSVNTYLYTGTTTTAIGVAAGIASAFGAGVLTNAYGVQVQTATTGLGGSIGTMYGLQVQPQSAAGTNYGAAIGTASTQTLWLGYDTNTSYGSNTGISFGSARDANLYRSAANTLKTDSSYLIQTTTNSNSALAVANQSGSNIFNVDSLNNFVGTVNTTAASTSSQALSLQSGTASGATSNSGAVSLKSGDSNTSGNTGSLSLMTGSAVSGNSGAINIDVGTPGGAGTAGAITIGTSNTRSVGVGNTTAATTTSISGGTGSSAVTIQAGSGGTLSFGTGGVANTIQIGTTTGSVTQTIGIGNNATSGSVNNLTIGNLLTSSNTAIQGGTGASAITLTQGTGGGIVIGGTGAASTVSIQCGAGTSTDCGFANNATDHTTVVGSTTGTSATTIQSGSGGLTLTGNITASGTYNNNTFSSTALTFSGANPVISASTTNTGMSLQANGTGTLALTTTGAGTVNLGTTGATTIAIGNSLATTGVTVSCGSGGCGFGDNATAHTTTVGSTTGTSSTAIQSGTGNLTIQTQGTGTLGIGNNAVAQNITIGNGTGATNVSIACGSGACNFGSNGVAHATTVGSSTGNSATNLQAGTGGFNIETQGTGAIAIGNNAVAQTINIGNSTGATAVSIACGTGPCGFGDSATAHTTTVGSNTGSATTLIQSGTGNLSLQTQGTGTLGIGNNAVAQNITIGNGTGATAITANCGTGSCNFGSNATDHSTNIGSITGTSLTTIQGGSGGVTINGNINAPGTFNSNTFSSSALTFAGASPVISASTTNTGMTLQANGSGTLTLNTSGAGTVNLGTTNTTAVAIGNGSGSTSVSVSCGTGICGFGNNATDHSTTLGSATGTSATTVQGGSGGILLDGSTTIAASKTLTVTSGLTSLTSATGANDALNVSNSTGTGNIAVFKDNATNVVTFADNGLTTFKPSSNSTSAFQVQPSGSSTPVLDVDTTNNRLGINTATPQSTLEINSLVGNTSGLRFTQLTSNSTGGTSFTGILGLDTNGNVGLSQASVSLTSPALAYWDGQNDPTTGSQSYPLATVASRGSNNFTPTFAGAGNGEQLTQAVGNQTGTIEWSFSQVPFEEIQFQMKAGTGAADGTWFYSYADGVPVTEYGGAGGGFTQGYIIYFSEYHDCVGITYGAYTDGRQCNSGGGSNPLVSVSKTGINDNAWHDVNIQILQNQIIVRWDNQVLINYTDVYTRDLSKLNFGFGARTGGSNNTHHIKNLLVTKLGINASNYNINRVSPLAVNNNTNDTLLSADNSATDANSGKIIIGNMVADTDQTLLQLDSFSTYGDTASCSATTNQGALYYNTSSAVVRGCVNGAWEDLVTTSGLGLIALGVIPDSGTDPGDLVSTPLATPGTGPCKVYQGSSTTTIRWTGCSVYSGGRKIVIPAQTSNVSTGTTNGFRHLCVNSTTGALGFVANAQTNDNTAAGLPTFSVATPVVCMATVQIASSVISRIYDTRFFTTSTKQAVNIITTGAAPGWLVTNTSTHGSFTPTGTTAGTGKIAGVVAVSAGNTTANSINAIIVTAGPVYVKATAGTIGDYIQNSTTAGYASTASTAPAPANNAFAVVGVAQSAFSTTCTSNNADTCRASLFTILDIK